jgi:hypothetical protein
MGAAMTGSSTTCSDEGFSAGRGSAATGALSEGAGFFATTGSATGAWATGGGTGFSAAGGTTIAGA